MPRIKIYVFIYTRFRKDKKKWLGTFPKQLDVGIGNCPALPTNFVNVLPFLQIVNLFPFPISLCLSFSSSLLLVGNACMLGKRAHLLYGFRLRKQFGIEDVF